MLPSRLFMNLLVVAGAIAATVSWPWLSARRLARSAQVRLRPWAWGAAMGRMLAGVFDPHAPVRVRGWSRAIEGVGRSGVLVLGGHLGSWEAAASELARRGRPPTVIAAPWPGLPRSQATLAALRSHRRVTALPRAPRAWKAATDVLRAGGTVVVLVDGVSADRPGRRGRPWILGRLAAPDVLIAWALRHGAAVWLAEGEPDGVRLHVLADSEVPGRAPRDRVEALGDRAVALLDDAVRRRPSIWAWVRPLACVALCMGCMGTACSLPELPTAIPINAEAWEAEVEDLAWEGTLQDAGVSGSARFFAESAVVRWVDGSPDGRFERIEITLPRADGEPSNVRIEAITAEGRWPGGPLDLREVTWEAAGVGGRLPKLVRRADGPDALAGWDCGGCELETLLQRMPDR
jgi:hypothetical protein